MYIFTFKTRFSTFFKIFHIKNMAINTNSYYSSVTGSNNIAIGSSSLYGTSFNTTIQKAKYHILGEDVEVSGYVDGTTAMMIATLNVLGKPFYDELKKNNVNFSQEIEDYLKIRFRDTKIDSILEYSDHFASFPTGIINPKEYDAVNEKKSIDSPTF